MSITDEQTLFNFLSDDYFGGININYYPPKAVDYNDNEVSLQERSRNSMKKAVKDYFAANTKQVADITKDLGYPAWEHAINFSDKEGDFYLLPFAKTNKNRLEAVLYVYKDDDDDKLGFNLLNRNDLRKYKNEKKLSKKKNKKKSKDQYEDLSVEYAVASVAVFEQEIFHEVDCELAAIMKEASVKGRDELESRNCFYAGWSQETMWYQSGGGSTSYIGSSYTYGGEWVCIYPVAYGPEGPNYGNSTTSGTGGSNNNANNASTANFELVNCDSNLDSIKLERTFLNCKVLYCIYQKLKSNGKSTFCKNVFRFNNSSLNLNINVGPTFSNSDGQVSMSSNGIGVNMTFNNMNCSNDDHILVAGNLIHESIHAKFKYVAGVTNSTTQSQYQQLWKRWVVEKYGQGYDPYNEDHIIILKYMTEIAEELRKLNGNKYDASHYMSWVWEGLSWHWTGKFSNSQIADWERKRIIVKMNSPFKCY